MSTRQLKDLFEAGLAAPAPDRVDVDAAIATGRRRRRIRVGSTVLASCAAVVVAVLITAGLIPRSPALPPVSPSVSQTMSPSGSVVPIPTSTWKPGDAGMAALAEGYLAVGDDRCLVLVDGGQGIPEIVPVWPSGFTALDTGTGIVVLDASGAEVARTGERITLGGGYTDGVAAGPSCTGQAREQYQVQEAPPYQRVPRPAAEGPWVPVQSSDELFGRWLPETIAGRDAAGAESGSGSPLEMRFGITELGQTVSAYDGCNSMGGRYTAGPDGVFTTAMTISAMACQPYPWSSVGFLLDRARAIEASASGPVKLRLLDAGGTVLVVYVRDAEGGPESSGAQARAVTLCTKTLASFPAGAEVLFSRPTTVEAVRGLTGGPAGAAIAADAWPELGGAELAAWCTIRSSGGYTISAAATQGRSITLVSSDAPLGDPGVDGPPIP